MIGWKMGQFRKLITDWLLSIGIVIMWLFRLMIIGVGLNLASSWSQEEMEIYDLIEEIGTEMNFYSILNVTQDATSSEIRRAFRQLSLTLHPDKNREEGADLRFRKIVGVHETLRSEQRRQIYDNFLKNGLPDWRSAMFYYRRVRKMGLFEVLAILSLIITVGQYLTAWAGYHDKKMIAEEQFRSKCKRAKMTQKEFAQYLEENLQHLRPSWINTLPFQLVFGCYWLITAAPFQLVAAVRAELLRRKQLLAEQQLQEERQLLATEEQEKQRLRRKEQKERRRQRVHEQTVRASAAPGTWEEGGCDGSTEDVVAVSWSTVRSGMWADDDLIELSRLVKKFPPGGASDRWEKIARLLERTVAEVTTMAHKIKERPQLVPLTTAAQSTALTPPPPPSKQKTRASDSSNSTQCEVSWSQVQQRALEQALVQFPKGTSERWERIARVVPGKDKEECMLRFKNLAENVRRKKLAESSQNEQNCTAASVCDDAAKEDGVCDADALQPDANVYNVAAA